MAIESQGTADPHHGVMTTPICKVDWEDGDSSISAPMTKLRIRNVSRTQVKRIFFANILRLIEWKNLRIARKKPPLNKVERTNRRGTRD